MYESILNAIFKMILSQKGDLVVELVETTFDYQPDNRIDKLSVQMKSGF